MSFQAKDTQDEKRHTGGDTFAVRVVSMDGKVEGTANVSDLQNGLYEVGYSAPLPGAYQVRMVHTGGRVPCGVVVKQDACTSRLCTPVPGMDPSSLEASSSDCERQQRQQCKQ